MEKFKLPIALLALVAVSGSLFAAPVLRPAPVSCAASAIATVYLFVNGVPVATSAVVTWGDGHVYDFVSGNLLGVLNADGWIVAPGGAVVGFLPGIEEVTATR